MLIDTIDIPVSLESRGAVTININEEKDENSKLRAEIIYRPELDSDLSGPLFMSYRNDIGFGNIIEMQKQPDGSFIGYRDILPSESSELGIHLSDPRLLTGPPDFEGGEHFQTHIPLIKGKIVNDTFINPSLSDEERGTLQKRIYRADGSLSDPLKEEKPDLFEGDELVYVYIPAGYALKSSDGHEYPVNIMLDGDMHVDIDPFGNRLKTPQILDNLISQGKMEPTVVVFHSPTPLSSIGMPRLREYGCNEVTASRLAGLPAALNSAGISTLNHGCCITGESMGGIQAIYTAKKYPDIFDKVIAQSPALWWEPPEKIKGDKFHVTYDDTDTWRKDPADKFSIDFTTLTSEQKIEMDNIEYKGFIHQLLTTGLDSRTGEMLPKSDIQIIMQVGCNETGTINPIVGREPLTQSTRTLARDFDIPLTVFDGPHHPGIWATGLCTALPEAFPKVEMNYRFSM